MRRSFRVSRGVALVELLVAAAILAVCVIPITGTISLIRTNAAEAKIQSQVLSGMRTILNQQLDNGKLSTLVKTLVPTVTTQTYDGGLTVTYSLTINPVSGYSKLYALTCTATWTSVGTANRSDSMTLTMYALTV